MDAANVKSAPVGAVCDPAKLSPRILLADDDEMLRFANRTALVHCGYVVDPAPNGALAWEALQAGCYDLLVTDNSMPEMTGFELLKKIHEAHLSLPVIMATGTFPADEIEAEPWLRPAAVLVKPYLLSQLLETVQKILAGSSTR